MRRSVVLGALWLVSLLIAGVTGAWLGGEDVASRARPVAASRGPGRSDREVSSARRSAEGPTLAGFLARAAGGPEEEDLSGAEALLPLPVLEPRESFSLEGVRTADEASRRFMEFVATQLAAGPEGHLAILQTIDREGRNVRRLQALFPNEREAVRHVYPWVRFLSSHEGEVVSLLETVYRNLGEHPQTFEGFDPQTLELFTEGLSALLPGAVPEDTLGRFRGYAEKALAVPEGDLPEALGGRTRRRIERNVENWAPLVAPEEALARLRSPDLKPEETMALLRRVRPEDLATLDVAELIGPLIDGRDREVLTGLGAFDLDARTVGRIDERLVAGVEAGRVDAWTVSAYAQATHRNGWPDAQRLIEAGLLRGGTSVEVFAASLLYLSTRPPSDYVRWVISTYPLPDALQSNLRRQFKLD